MINRFRCTAALLVAPLALPGAARAMNHDVHVMRLCKLAVAQVKPFSPPVWERHHEMLMGSCLHNRGTIPGAVAHEGARSGGSIERQIIDAGNDGTTTP